VIDTIGQRGGSGVPGRSTAPRGALADGFAAAAERALAAAASARAHGGAGRRAEAAARLGAVEMVSAEAARGLVEPGQAEAAVHEEAAGESAPVAGAARAVEAVRVAISRGEGGRSALDLHIGDWLHVRLVPGERGVAITIGCDRALAPLLQRALPRLLRHLRNRGIAVSRAEVVPLSRSGRRAPR